MWLCWTCRSSAQAHLEARLVAADDVIDEAVALGLQRRHVAVAVCVLLYLPHTGHTSRDHFEMFSAAMTCVCVHIAPRRDSKAALPLLPWLHGGLCLSDYADANPTRCEEIFYGWMASSAAAIDEEQ